MRTNNDITTSNMTSIRRAPPLPVKGIQPSPMITSKHVERTQFPQHNTLTFTKKTSQAALNQQLQRRRSMENNARTIELVDSTAYMPAESQRMSNYRSSTCAEVNIANDLLQILKDENKNLKEQNSFLLTKIRQINESEKMLKEAVVQYELITNQLGEQNRQLKTENRQLTEIASRKVNEFGNKLAELMTESAEVDSQPGFKYRESGPTYQHFNSAGTPSQYYTMLNSNQYSSVPGAQYSMPPVPPKPLQKADTSTEPNDSLLEELSNQFDALLYSCSVEKNLESRKEIRKKLLELTSRMNELKK